MGGTPDTPFSPTPPEKSPPDIEGGMRLLPGSQVRPEFIGIGIGIGIGIAQRGR